MKPSAKRALLLPAWLERKYYSRAAGFLACGLQPNREVLTGGVGLFSGPARHGGLCGGNGRAEPDRREWFGPLSDAGVTVVARVVDLREAARGGWGVGSAAWLTFGRRGRAWADVTGASVATAGGWV